jgi:15-cis-phytoene synthase
MLREDLATPADLALCRQMIRQGSKSFHLASLLLPATHREQARSLYGFCRMADDMVDHATNPKTAVSILAGRLDAIYAGHPQAAATDRAFADVVHRFGIPRAVPDALIEGFAWDAEGRHYATLSDVTAYSVRVAGTVGVMMALIMGRRDTESLARAIDLGVAMQFSNIARDVVEDARLARVYLPADWLAESGVSPQQVLQVPQTGAAAASRLVAEADMIYARATTGIARLPASCRASINAARALYAEIGHLARRTGHNTRAVVPTGRKLRLLAQAVAQTPFLPRHSAGPVLPEAQFLLDAVARTPAPETRPKGLVRQLDWVMQMFIALETRRP